MEKAKTRFSDRLVSRPTMEQSLPTQPPLMHDQQSHQWWCNNLPNTNTPFIIVKQSHYSLLRWSACSSLWPFTTGPFYSIHADTLNVFAFCPDLGIWVIVMWKGFPGILRHSRPTDELLLPSLTMVLLIRNIGSWDPQSEESWLRKIEIYFKI